MRLPVLVHHAVLRLFAHPVGAEIVRRGIGRRRECADRADGFVKRLALRIGVVAHGNIVRVIVIIDIGNRQAVFVLHILAERDAVFLLRHVFADDPQARHVDIIVERRGEAAPPAAGIEEGRHEGQAERDGFHLVAADETAFRIVRGLVADDACHGGAAIHVHRLFKRGIDRAGGVAHIVAPHLSR